MTDQEKKDFLKRMGYYGGLSTPKRIEPEVVQYKKPVKKGGSLYVDKSELMNLYRIFDDHKARAKEV